jgi:hypothetical protein
MILELPNNKEYCGLGTNNTELWEEGCLVCIG